jgi:hypothetical protein
MRICRYFAIKNSFTSINTVFLTKNHGLLIANSFLLIIQQQDMVKLTPNLNPRGWDEMFSKDGVETHTAKYYKH